MLMDLDSCHTRMQIVASLSYRARRAVRTPYFLPVGAVTVVPSAQFKYYEMYKRGKLDGVRSRKRRREANPPSGRYGVTPGS